MGDDLEKKEKDKYEDVDPWKLVTEVPKALLTTAAGVAAIGIFAPLGWALSIFDEDSEKELKRDPKLKILRTIITNAFWEDLDDRELKIACHIVNSPWIPKDRQKTIEELEKILNSSNLEKNKLLIKKYLDPLSDRQIYVLRHNIFSDPPKETKFNDFKRKKFRKLWIERITDTYARNVRAKRDSDNSDEFLPELGKLFSNISLYFSSLYNAMLSTDDLSKEFDSLTKNLFEDTDTIYKKAVDANYVSDLSAYGGPYHRLFDDSHSIGKMYEKIKDAKPDDSKLEEIFAWVNEAAKDFQTTMGLPIVSMNKETFDSMANFLKPVGINKNDLYDVLTGNLQEFLGAAFLGITSLIPSIKKDKKRLRSLKGVMVASGAFGNPFALILLLMTLVYSMVKGDTEQFKKDLMSKEAISGFAITAIIKYAFDYLGAKIVLTLLGILLGLMLVVYFIRHRKNINVDLEKFKKEFVKELETLREMSKKQLEKKDVKSLPKND